MDERAQALLRARAYLLGTVYALAYVAGFGQDRAWIRGSVLIASWFGWPLGHATRAVTGLAIAASVAAPCVWAGARLTGRSERSRNLVFLLAAAPLSLTLAAWPALAYGVLALLGTGAGLLTETRRGWTDPRAGEPQGTELRGEAGPERRAANAGSRPATSSGEKDGQAKSQGAASWWGALRRNSFPLLGALAFASFAPSYDARRLTEALFVAAGLSLVLRATAPEVPPGH